MMLRAPGGTTVESRWRPHAFHRHSDPECDTIRIPGARIESWHFA